MLISKIGNHVIFDGQHNLETSINRMLAKHHCTAAMTIIYFTLQLLARRYY